MDIGGGDGVQCMCVLVFEQKHANFVVETVFKLSQED